MVKSIIILAIFLVLAVLMVMKKLPTLAALPILGIVIGLICGMPLNGVTEEGANAGILNLVIGDGTTMLAGTYVTVIMGAWLAQIMTTTGVTKETIRRAAEFGGDRPLVIALVLSAVVALLFTTLSGLGSIIMVGSIVIPVLLSVGIPALTASCIFLLAFSVGSGFALSKQQMLSDMFGVPLADVQVFAIILTVISALTLIAFILIEFKKNKIKYAFAAKVDGLERDENSVVPPITGFMGWMAMATPLIPLLLVIAFKVPIVPAFLAGIVWVLIFTFRFKNWSGAMNILTKCCYEGFKDAAPSVVLMMGVGMVLKAINSPQVSSVMQPFITAITPTGVLGFILMFGLLAPFALMRGPLNIYGMGAGIGALMIGVGAIPAVSIMAALFAIDRFTNHVCPTSTQVIWAANYTQNDAMAATKKLFIPTWISVIVAIVIAGFMYV